MMTSKVTILAPLDPGETDNRGDPLSLFFPSPPFTSLPLEVGPLYPARGSGERCKLPSGVWGGAPAEIEFGAF